jgi:5-methyltetrahydrofolate--homocysteine methyltransferase
VEACTVPAVAPELEPDLSREQRDALAHLQDCLLEFDGPGLAGAVQSALDAGLSPLDIVLRGMAAGMKQVGQLYEAGEFFLPQLVMAGATMKQGMAALEPLLQGTGRTGDRHTVVLGTVQGDLHDIGKNLVGMMLQGAGFAVFDLGVDVAPQRFVEAVVAQEADIVALSALLTTTMPNMGRVLDLLAEGGLRGRVKVMIGGAPISQAFADRIGADGYAADAVKAIEVAQRLLSLG